jgi:CRISPR-associated protein Cas1
LRLKPSDRLDAWAVTLFNKQDLRADHFSTTQEGCFLGKAGREHFYHAWEPLAEQLRKRLETTAQAVLKRIETLAPKLPEVDLEANSE